MPYTQTNAAVPPPVQQAPQASLGGKGGQLTQPSFMNGAQAQPSFMSNFVQQALGTQDQANKPPEYTYTPAPIQQSPNQQTLNYSNPSTPYYVAPQQSPQQSPSQGWNASSFMQGLRSLGLKGYQ